MSGYKPTTTGIRGSYCDGRVDHSYGGVATSSSAGAEFDQWLDEHDAQMRAEGRAEAIADMRWLASKRAEYDHIPEGRPGAYWAASESDRALKVQHKAVEQVANILEGVSDGAGWLPSWRWDEWETRRDG